MNDAVTNATIALAVVAGLAFLVNVWLAVENRKSIDTATKATVAATRQAEASEKVAVATDQLVKETQRNRELEWQPLLRYEDTGSLPGNFGGMQNLDGTTSMLANTGRGPAFKSVLVWRARDGLLALSSQVSIGAGSKHFIGGTNHEITDANTLIPREAQWAAFCEDQFGIKYRFLDDGSQPDTLRPEDNQSVVGWALVWTFANPMTRS